MGLCLCIVWILVHRSCAWIYVADLTNSKPTLLKERIFPWKPTPSPSNSGTIITMHLIQQPARPTALHCPEQWMQQRSWGQQVIYNLQYWGQQAIFCSTFKTKCIMATAGQPYIRRSSLTKPGQCPPEHFWQYKDFLGFYSPRRNKKLTGQDLVSLVSPVCLFCQFYLAIFKIDCLILQEHCTFMLVREAFA